VKLVVNSENATELIKKDFKDIRNKISIVMGQNCIVEFEIVDDIRPTKSGIQETCGMGLLRTTL